MGSIFSTLCPASKTRDEFDRKYSSVSNSAATESRTALSDLDFRDWKVVGRGAYGEAFSATHQQTGEVWAIKKIPRTDVDRYVREECLNLAKCNHTQIIGYIDVSLKHLYPLPSSTTIDELHIPRTVVNSLQQSHLQY